MIKDYRYGQRVSNTHEQAEQVKQEVYNTIADELYRILIAEGYSPSMAARVSSRFKQRVRKKYPVHVDHPFDPNYALNDSTPQIAQIGQYYHYPEHIIRHEQQVTQPQNNPQLVAPELTSDYENNGQAYISETQDHSTPTVPDMQCPYCGFSTLTIISSADDLGRDREYRCTNCAAMFFEQDLIDQAVLTQLTQTMMHNPSQNPENLPTWSPKSLNEYETVKSWVGFEYEKSLDKISDYIGSVEYNKLLREYLSDVSGKKREQIKNVLRDALKGGHSIHEIKAKIAGIINDEDRADIISRTEVVRITNEGNRRKLKEEGIKKVQWISAPSLDKRLCEECRQLDGKVFTVEQVKGKIPLHPFCRCSLGAAI